MSRPELAAFAAALRAAMSRRGVDNGAVADAAGVTRQQVSAWRNGHNAPSARSVAIVEKLLQVPRGELFSHLYDVPGPPTPAGYDARISQLPEHVRRTIDEIIDNYESRR